MKIVVVSDTHIPKRAKKLPQQILPDLQNSELIIHAGDWQTIEVYHELAQFCEVKGVSGNVDSDEVKALFPEKIVLEIHGHKIGVVHGHGQRLTTEKRALAAFKGENVNCIIFGHSHIPLLKNVGDILLFNPGSATDKRRQKQYSYGVLTISDEIKAKHVYFEDKQ